MILQNVSLLETTYPCWAYALARVGKKDLLSLTWIRADMPRLLNGYEHYAYDLHKGDILVWKNKESEDCYCPTSITQDGDIIWEKLEYAHHVCVYEGGGLISDMVKTDGNFELPFIIRKRILCDLSNPDYVIRFAE